MYHSFSIKNFRCFDDLTLEGLGRINLIGGRNNIGKTAVLEALWIHHGAVNPDLGMRVDAFRGVESGDPENFMSSLFYGFDRDSVIELSAQGDWGDTARKLEIVFESRPTAEVAMPGLGKVQTDVLQTSSVGQPGNKVVFDYCHDTGEQITSSGWLVERPVGPGLSALAMEKTQNVRPYQENGILLSSGRVGISEQDVNRYSRLEINGQQDGVLQILQLIEPNLKRLAVVSAGQTPSVYADMGLGRLIPVQLMGAGMSRILSLSLSIATVPGGMVLVDEIENGLHYTVMEKVWQAVAAFARHYDVQIFATTHSHHCIQSACRAFAADEEEPLSLYVLGRSAGKMRSVRYGREKLATAFEFGFGVI